MTLQNIKIGLIGFDEEDALEMKKSGLNIKCHIYFNIKNKKKHTLRTEKNQNIHSWKSYDFTETLYEYPPENILENVKQKCFEEFVRCTNRWSWSAELIYNWNDYDHLFRLACYHAYGWIKKHKIDCLVFSNVPHQGIAVVHYFLARELGLKTLVFLQSPMPDKSFLIEHWADDGVFKTSVANMLFNVDISAPKKSPFYMNSVKNDKNRILKNLVKRLRATVILGLNFSR